MIFLAFKINLLNEKLKNTMPCAIFDRLTFFYPQAKARGKIR